MRAELIPLDGERVGILFTCAYSDGRTVISAFEHDSDEEAEDALHRGLAVAEALEKAGTITSINTYGRDDDES
jgi:hypothetical protein